MLFLPCILVHTCLKLLMFFAMPFPLKLFICNYLLAICLMPVLYFSLPGTTLASMFSQELKEETFYYRASTFAESTKATCKSHRDSYLRFCIFIGYTSIPATTFLISQYASFWARSFKFSSVKAYLGVISLLQKEFSLPNPLSLIIDLLNLF